MKILLLFKFNRFVKFETIDDGQMCFDLYSFYQTDLACSCIDEWPHNVILSGVFLRKKSFEVPLYLHAKQSLLTTSVLFRHAPFKTAIFDCLVRWESLDNLPTALKSRFFLQFNKEVQLIDNTTKYK